MPEVKKSVGDGGDNQVHDVALVQAMLVVVKNAKSAAYLAPPYTGTYDAGTKAAIAAFQQDHKLIEPPNYKPDAKNPAKFDKAAFVGVNSETLKQLTKALPADYQEMRIIENTRTVYLPMDQAAATANAAKINTHAELNASFRTTVAKLVTTMYDRHKIVLSIPADGWRRDFAAQAKIPPANTGSGPGESNHQYGQAVDIGMNGLRWIDGTGQIKKDNFWLDAAKMTYAKQQEFWNARNAIAITQLGLFKTNKAGDFIHLQGFNDGTVSYRRSLASLLQSVSVGNMKWAAAGGKLYESDLGLGGARYGVGTAREIWDSKSAISKADLAKALNAKIAADKAFNIEKFFKLPAAPAVKNQAPAKQAGAPAPAVLKEADIKDAYLASMRKMLKSEFESADKHWAKWKPIP
jgi:peptidoglycan hydrolase-like protein with peptidoglycan-binding domain